MAAVMTACCLQLDPEQLVHDAVDRFIAAFAAAEKEEEPVPAEELLETRLI